MNSNVNTTQDADPYPWLTPHGECAALLRGKDWSRSPLGPMHTWSTQLKLMANFVLTSKIPMYMWWGAEGINIYNDAYIPTAGEGRHPQLFGEPAAVMWPEIWAIMAEYIHTVSTTRESICSVDRPFKLKRDGVLQDAYFTFSFNPAVDENGVVQGIVAIVQETTGTVQARTELVAERERLHGLFMQTPFPFCILHGPNHTFSLANGAYVRLVAREVQGKTLAEVFTDAERAYYVPIVEKVYRTNEPFVVSEAPLNLVDADGVTHDQFIDVVYYPYRDGAGRATGVMVIVTDVTERVTARKKIEENRDRLAEAVAMRDEFLSVASHELRTPLTGMRIQAQMFLRLLARNDPSIVTPQKVAKLVEVVDRSTLRLIRLVEDMLDSSRMQSGKLTLIFEAVDLGAVVIETLERMRPELEQAGIVLRLEVGRGAMASVDRVRIEQVVANLATNAMRYAAGKPLDVKMAVRDGQATIRVRDYGRGIGQADQERIFKRFERLVSVKESTLR